MSVKITSGNTDDRAALRDIAREVKGKCYADKGYIGKKIFKELWEKGLQLITGIRWNMKNHLMPYFDKAMLRKRFIIETIFRVLKTEMNLEHSRHRTPTNAFASIMAALIAYSYKKNKLKTKTNLIMG